jgi:hypothetical protein
MRVCRLVGELAGLDMPGTNKIIAAPPINRIPMPTNKTGIRGKDFFSLLIIQSYCLQQTVMIPQAFR